MSDDNLRDMDNPLDDSHEKGEGKPNGEDIQPDSQEIQVVSDEEIEEMPSSIFGGFQIVRSEFFSQLHEPAITFNQGKIGVNSACLKKLPNINYAQILVNREKKMLAIRPCQETEIFSFQWCSYRARDHKRQPRQITAKMLFMKICSLMNWNMDYRYKILGKLIRANNEYLFIFNLRSAQTFVREPAAEGEKPKTSRNPVFPAEWQNQFGIPFEDHQKALQINMFQGFAVYSIKDDSTASLNEQTKLSDQTSPDPPEDQQGDDTT